MKYISLKIICVCSESFSAILEKLGILTKLLFKFLIWVNSRFVNTLEVLISCSEEEEVEAGFP